MSGASGDPGHEIVARGAPEAYLASIQAYAALDPSFQRDALAAAQAVGFDNLTNLVTLHARFDHPGGVVYERDGTERDAPYHALHQLLQVIPGYAQRAALAGLTPGQASGLVETLLSAAGRNEWSIADLPVVSLGRALELQAQAHGPMTAEDYVQVRGLIADTAGHEEHNESALDAYRALSRLGMTTEESVAFIRTGLLTDAMLIEPAAAVFNALAIAEVDTQTLTAICRQLIGSEEDPRQIYAIRSDFERLRECIVTVGPGQDIHPNNLLTAIHAQLGQGRSMSEVAEGFVGTGRLPQAEAVGAYHPQDRARQHFLAKKGPLELSPLPYRTERSFEDGVRDLGGIALHRSRYLEEVGEGLWVFDSDALQPTWYSLGGETELRAGVAHHEYPAYPLHELSRNPWMLHCHPADLETRINPGFDTDLYPAIALPVVDRFFAATPSRRDYQMIAELLRAPDGPQSVRSFVVHGTGLTEYTFPQDPEALDEMTRTSQALRTDLLATIDWGKILYARRLAGLRKGKRRETDDVVRELVERFDRAMPAGFGLQLFAIERP